MIGWTAARQTFPEHLESIVVSSLKFISRAAHTLCCAGQTTVVKGLELPGQTTRA